MQSASVRNFKKGAAFASLLATIASGATRALIGLSDCSLPLIFWTLFKLYARFRTFLWFFLKVATVVTTVDHLKDVRGFQISVLGIETPMFAIQIVPPFLLL